jgi:Plasmid pRiA4b ORF-3-like protein
MPRRAAITTAEGTTHVLRALLRPTLYRDIELESTNTLHTLAWGITRAFGFDFEHAFGFFNRLTGRVFASPIRYELLPDAAMEGASRDVHEAPVARAFPRLGSKMLFVYDYGDEWRFRVELIGRGEAAASVAYPRVVARLGKAPEQYPGTDVS